MDRRLGGCLYLGPLGQKPAVLVDPGLASGLRLPFTPRRIPKIVEGKAGALDALDAADRSDVVYFLVSSRLPGSVLRRRIENYGFTLYPSYVILPGFSNPKWFLPQDRMLVRNCGNFVKPSSLKAKAAWGLTRFMYSLNYPQLIFPSRLIVARREDSGDSLNSKLKDFLIDVLENDSIELLMYAGAQGYYQKFTVQVVDRKGITVAYAKIGNTDQARKRIEVEGKVLREFEQIRLSRLVVPKLIRLDHLEDFNATILVQTPSTGYDECKRTLDVRHMDALADLFRITRRDVQGDELVANMMETIDGIVIESEKLRRLLAGVKKAVFRLAPRLEGKDFVLGTSHGDFTPWNVYLRGESVFAFDWECSSQRFPLWDAYNFMIHSEVLIFKRNSKDLFSMVSDPQGKYAHLIAHYVHSAGISRTIDKPLLLSWYLIEMLIYYINITARQEACGPGKDIHEDRVMAIVSSLLEMSLDRDSHD